MVIRLVAALALGLIALIFDRETAKFFTEFGAGVAIGGYVTEKAIRAGVVGETLSEVA